MQGIYSGLWIKQRHHLPKRPETETLSRPHNESTKLLVFALPPRQQSPQNLNYMLAALLLRITTSNQFEAQQSGAVVPIKESIGSGVCLKISFSVNLDPTRQGWLHRDKVTEPWELSKSMGTSLSTSGYVCKNTDNNNDQRRKVISPAIVLI